LHEDLDRSFDWFIGSGLDKDTVDALVREDELQKEKIAKEDALSRR
jgi:hypothetical protein